jgi:hypothetical protein
MRTLDSAGMDNLYGACQLRLSILPLFCAHWTLILSLHETL